MRLGPQGEPEALPRPERLSEGPEVYRFRGLVSAGECAEIAGAAEDLLEPAIVFDEASGRRIVHPVRTSYGAVIGPTRESLPIQAVNRRLAALRFGHVTPPRSKPQARRHDIAMGKTSR